MKPPNKITRNGKDYERIYGPCHSIQEIQSKLMEFRQRGINAITEKGHIYRDAKGYIRLYRSAYDTRLSCVPKKSELKKLEEEMRGNIGATVRKSIFALCQSPS